VTCATANFCEYPGGLSATNRRLRAENNRLRIEIRQLENRVVVLQMELDDRKAWEDKMARDLSVDLSQLPLGRLTASSAPTISGD